MTFGDGQQPLAWTLMFKTKTHQAMALVTRIGKIEVGHAVVQHIPISMMGEGLGGQIKRPGKP